MAQEILSDLIITTQYGKLQGIDHGDYLEFRKVPFAKPPVAQLRFKAPQKPEKWDGIYQAVEYAPRCMAFSNAYEPWLRDFYSDSAYDRSMSEDCLYMNIWVPKTQAGDSCEKDSYPVAMWIHGGAFTNGYATEKEFDGAAYARRGIILASIQYRCNIFGFLAHPWLSQENENGLSGNYGILDQIAALDWLYENIECFGGNKDKITVMGQSAGAISVQTLVSSPLTSGKIAGAILQSGGAYGKVLGGTITLKEQEEKGLILTELLGVKNLEELRRIPAEQLLDKLDEFTQAASNENEDRFLMPTIDQYVLNGSYNEIMDQDKIADIPYMLGATRNDIDVMWPDENGIRPTEQTFLYQSSIDFSLKLEELGRTPAYVYYFTRALPGDDWGAFHSAELVYMFGTLDRVWRPWTDYDRALSTEMIERWAAFIKNGNPNTDQYDNWMPCSTKQEKYVKEF